MKKLLCILFFLQIMSSCYKEVLEAEPDSDLFEMYVDEKQVEFSDSSKDTTFTISSLGIYFNGQLLNCNEIRIRGKSTPVLSKKHYTVFLNEPLVITEFGKRNMKRLVRFKLIALEMDYTFIENRIALGLLKEAGIMPLFYKFVELKMNNETQGLYLLLEDPEQYGKENGSEFVLRRGINHHIDASEYTPNFHYNSESEYRDRFNEIYSQLLSCEGQDLYDKTSERLKLEDYFKKMCIDYLLQNGDATNEVHFYSRVEQGNIRYYIIPWEYDDIFEDMPHEIGETSGIGTLFGQRKYDTITDIFDDIGEKLIFSIEDDLDYTIAKDPLLYAKYLEAFSRLLHTVNEDFIDRVFIDMETELGIFYESDDLISQSRYNTSKDVWLKNMNDKKEFIKYKLKGAQHILDL